MTYENFDVSFHDEVAMIRLANPDDPNNSLGTAFLRDLQAVIPRVASNPGLKLVLFIGTSRAFSSGANLDKLADATEEEIAALLHEGQWLLQDIMGLNVITIAAVNGVALGGGLELALACDIRWAHRRAVFGLPEVRRGLLPGWGGLSLLRRIAPESLCVEMAAGGQFIGARRAYEAGLVSRLFEGRDFEAAALSEALRELKLQLKRGRGSVDLSAGNGSFLTLWKARRRTVRAPAVPLEATA